MFDTVKTDLYTLAEASRTEDAGKLARYRTVLKGDFPPLTQNQPCLTIDWDGKFRTVFNGNHFELTATFALTTYVSSHKPPDADAEMEKCLLHYEDGEWTGLFAWLGGHTGFRSDSGQTYSLTPQPDTRRGTVSSEKANVCTQACVVLVDVSTMVSRTNFL